MAIQKLRIGDFRLAYQIHGSGPHHILWIHGYPLNADMWRPQVDAPPHIATHITPDLRGFGQSDGPAPPYHIDDFADDLIALLDHLQIQNPILAGLSMGGYIAFAFLRKYPHRASALILADTHPNTDPTEIHRARLQTAAKVHRTGIAPVVNPMLEKLLTPESLDNKPLVYTVRKIAERSSPNGIAGALHAMARRPDSNPTLQSLTIPTQIIVGEHDTITPPSLAQQMHNQIPNNLSTLTTIPQSAHLPNLENPQPFNQSITTFLNSL